jgi:hypothetical protein
MAYTVTKLITDAYYLSGRLSEGLNTISGDQLAKGLRLLNSILAIHSVDERLIPYFTKYQFNAEIDTEEYFIPDLIYVETLTFDYSSVRWSMKQTTRKQYQGSSRANNIDSLMYEFYVERCKGGANLFMYFKPDQAYPMTIWGKFSLSSVVQNQDLEATLDRFYIEYLRVKLGKYIASDANITFQPYNEELLQQYEKIFLDTSTPDLTVRKMSAFGSEHRSIWGQVNLGHGWTAP